MKLLDVHCHLDEFFYKEDIEGVIKRARENNVKVFPSGINPETNRHVLKLYKKYPDVVRPCLGLYPMDALKKEMESSEDKLNTDFDADAELEFIYDNRDKIVAIGEVGMDFKNGRDFDMQEKIFRKVIELSLKIDKPMIIHSRKAEKRVIEILEEYKCKNVVMHCFSGKYDLVKRVRENDWNFSIPTTVVRDEHFQRIVKETSLYRIFTETDSPFLSPFPGKRNEPSFVRESIKKIAELRNMDEADVANIIYRNAEYVFGKLN